MSETKNVSMVSLGCPKNLVDAEVMLGLLQEQGYQITMDEKEADVIIVNTCSFIKEAREESVDAVLDLLNSFFNLVSCEGVVTIRSSCLHLRFLALRTTACRSP